MPATVGGNTIGARTNGRSTLTKRRFPLAKTQASGTPNTTHRSVASRELQMDRRMALSEFGSPNLLKREPQGTLVKSASSGRINTSPPTKANPRVNGSNFFRVISINSDKSGLSQNLPPIRGKNTFNKTLSQLLTWAGFHHAYWVLSRCGRYPFESDFLKYRPIRDVI